MMLIFLFQGGIALLAFLASAGVNILSAGKSLSLIMLIFLFQCGIALLAFLAAAGVNILSAGCVVVRRSP